LTGKAIDEIIIGETLLRRCFLSGETPIKDRYGWDLIGVSLRKEGNQMENDNKDTGYSEALGGFGVPSQVEASGASAVSAAQSGGQSPASRPKSKKIIILVVVIAVIAAAGAALWYSGVLESLLYSSSVAEIEKHTQDVNGAAAVNYLPRLADNVDWTGASDSKREGIAKYAVRKALKQAKAEQAGIFTIMGIDHNRTPVFLYEQVGRIQIYVEGNVIATDTIAIE
jgi:hypothetical protein